MFLGTQQQTLLTSCWQRPQVKPNSREPAGISPARTWFEPRTFSGFCDVAKVMIKVMIAKII